MTFETVSKQYQVTRLLREGDGFSSYLCTQAGRPWIAIRFSEKLTEQLFPYFMVLKEQQAFEDLEDLFSWQENLIVILAYRDMDVTLKMMWEQEDVSNREKLRLLEAILTGCCIRELPIALAADLLKSGNAGICTDGVPGFYYDLQAPETYLDTSVNQAVMAWCEGAKRLFARPMRQGLGRELERFCAEQEQHPPASFLELYTRFQPVKTALEKQMKEGSFMAKERGVRAWLMLKRGIAIAKKLVLAAVLLGAAWALLSLLFQGTDLGVPAFSSIGTVVL